MLWYKGWLETRFRLLFALALVGFSLVSLYSVGLRAQTGVLALVGIATVFAATLSFMLAGAGIATQPALQATQGLHGSMLFTLSLPVSRFRLLAVRAGLGWLEMVGGIGMLCCGTWALFPILRVTTTAAEMLDYAGVLITCASGLYSISVLLATFLDDQWRMWGSIFAFAALWWLSNHTPLPASANIFRAMVQGSPLIAHTMPWTAMVFSLGLAAILFFAALKVVRTREY
jgi:hypothetical protein